MCDGVWEDNVKRVSPAICVRRLHTSMPGSMITEPEGRGGGRLAVHAGGMGRTRRPGPGRHGPSPRTEHACCRPRLDGHSSARSPFQHRCLCRTHLVTIPVQISVLPASFSFLCAWGTSAFSSFAQRPPLSPQSVLRPCVTAFPPAEDGGRDADEEIEEQPHSSTGALGELGSSSPTWLFGAAFPYSRRLTRRDPARLFRGDLVHFVETCRRRRILPEGWRGEDKKWIKNVRHEGKSCSSCPADESER